MATIKKIILLALTAVMIVGCNGMDETNIPLEKTSIKIDGWVAHICITDSCEYITLGHGITHKGNCHFCKERDSIKWENRKKELEELIIKLKEITMTTKQKEYIEFIEEFSGVKFKGNPNSNKDISEYINSNKEKCCEVLAEFLKKEGYFSVEFDPREVDIDKLGKA